MRQFEDFEVGQVFDCGEATVSEEDLIGFARKYDPQPMHLDPAAAAKTPLQGLALSGWHTASVFMRRYYEGVLRHSHSLGAPQIKDLRWKAPVRPDAPLRFSVEVAAKRESKSRPELGFVSMTARAIQDDKPVMSLAFPGMFGRRGQAETELRPVDRT